MKSFLSKAFAAFLCTHDRLAVFVYIAFAYCCYVLYACFCFSLNRLKGSSCAYVLMEKLFFVGFMNTFVFGRIFVM